MDACTDQGHKRVCLNWSLQVPKVHERSFLFVGLFSVSDSFTLILFLLCTFQSQVGVRVSNSKQLGRRPVRLQVNLGREIKSNASLINLELLKMFKVFWAGGGDILYKEYCTSHHLFFPIVFFRLVAFRISYHVPCAVSACVP